MSRIPSMLKGEEVGWYRADLDAHPHLSFEETNALIEQIAQAQEQEDHAQELRLKQQLATGHQRTMLSMAMRYDPLEPCHLTFTDLIQEGNLALMEALHHFDYRHSHPKGFIPYARLRIHGVLCGAMRSIIPVSMPLGDYHEMKRTGQIEEVFDTLLRRTRLDDLIEGEERDYSLQDYLIAAPTLSEQANEAHTTAGLKAVEDGKAVLASLVVHPVRVVVPRTSPKSWHFLAKASGQENALFRSLSL